MKAQQDQHTEGQEDSDYFEHFRFQVDPGQSPLRIDKFLFDRIENISRNKIQLAAKAKSILVNNQVVKSNYKVRPNDVITIVFARPPVDYQLEAEDVGLSIVYEDDEVLVINKHAGLVVHPGHGHHTGTLVNGLLYLQKDWPEINGVGRPGIVHRLDKNTSGIIVVGKTDDALTKLAKQFYERTIDRRYIALSWGDFDELSGRIEGNIGRDPRHRIRMKVFPEGEIGKHAVTNYKVVKRYGYVSLLECKLETGRTHQIRVHLQSQGHPLFNDYIYGGDRIVKGTVHTKYKQFIQNCFSIMPYHCLHAKSLRFMHPTTKKELYFEADLPENFQELLSKWDVYASAYSEKLK